MEAVALLQRLGWEWRHDGAGTGAGPGVLFTVRVSGRTQNVFVPLQRVWTIFDQELSRVGCVGCSMVGAPYSVGGLFSSIKKAVSGAVKKVVPKAIQRAATRVVATAKKAVNKVAKIPVLGSALKGVANAYKAGMGLVLLPQIAAVQLLDGKRIDRAAIDTLRGAVRNVQTVAPYVQTVISVVPGVGQGISAGLGGALALAEGRSIDDALLAAVKSSLPGGPLAQAAFAVASGALQGKPLDAVALSALPIGAAEKQALVRGLGAAKQLAAGKRVDQVLLDQAIRSLPPAAQKAVQIGTAMGQARNLQGALRNAAGGAAQLAGDYAKGVQAAKAFKNGVRSPAVLEAMKRAQASKGALSNIVQQASRGNQQAAHIVRALQAPRPSARPLPPRFTPPAVRSFTPFAPQRALPQFSFPLFNR